MRSREPIFEITSLLPIVSFDSFCRRSIAAIFLLPKESRAKYSSFDLQDRALNAQRIVTEQNRTLGDTRYYHNMIHRRGDYGCVSNGEEMDTPREKVAIDNGANRRNGEG